MLSDMKKGKKTGILFLTLPSTPTLGRLAGFLEGLGPQLHATAKRYNLEDL